MGETADSFRGTLWMLGAMFCFALMITIIRDLGQTYSSFQLVFIRSVIGLSVVTPVLLRKGVGAFRTPQFPLHLGRVLLTYLAMTAFFTGLVYVPVAEAVSVQFTLPIFTMLLATLFLAERPGWRRWSAAAAGLIGVTIIVRPGFAEFHLPMLMVIASTALYASTMILVKILARSDRSEVIVFYANLLLTPVSLIPALLNWRHVLVEDLDQLLLLGVAGTAAWLLQAKALRLAEVSIVIPMDYLRLPFVAVLGYLILDEFPDIWTWCGATIIGLSTFYISRIEAQRAHSSIGESSTDDVKSPQVRIAPDGDGIDRVPSQHERAD